jgi:pyrimidine-nucleoside phosphorylase
MLTASLIAKKRDGQILRDDEIRFLIEGYVSGTIADYQMSALAMAILLRGMNAEEIASLTKAMTESGDRLPRDSSGPPRIDKHSTGGLGDKVSLILAPLLACHDVHVPMISGRGLGLTGGTLDKLEAIPGFRVQLDQEQGQKQLKEIGCMIVGANDRVAPADRKLYALRDVTATVESVALITASILSKKLAANLDALIMDVKVGSGAFMKTEADALFLAKSIVSTGRLAGLPTRAILTDMDQPLGWAVGNAIEVNETLRLLDGSENNEVLDLTIDLCAEGLLLCNRYDSYDVAVTALNQSILNGAARERFEQMVAAQGGQITGMLPLANEHIVTAKQDGYVAQFDCQALGQCVVEMGGGRRVTTDKIDPAVGVRVMARIGDKVTAGQPLMMLYARSNAEKWLDKFDQVMTLINEPVDARPLVISRMDEKAVTE